MAGAPAKYDTAQAIQEAVAGFFKWAEGEYEDIKIPAKEGEPEHTKRNWLRYPEKITITGLALHIGFESRQSIYDYEEKGEFSYIIKNARLRVENAYEQMLHGTTPTGSIFALKNMGWKDNQRTELTGADGGPVQLPAITINVVKPDTNGEGDTK